MADEGKTVVTAMKVKEVPADIAQEAEELLAGLDTSRDACGADLNYDGRIKFRLAAPRLIRSLLQRLREVEEESGRLKNIAGKTHMSMWCANCAALAKVTAERDELRKAGQRLKAAEDGYESASTGDEYSTAHVEYRAAIESLFALTRAGEE